MLWSWRLPENRASGGAGARDLVLCAMGSGGGREGDLTTLGVWATASAKVRRRGTAGAGRGDLLGVRMAETGGMEGVLGSVGVMGGDATLGGALSCTLGGAGAGLRA